MNIDIKKRANASIFCLVVTVIISFQITITKAQSVDSISNLGFESGTLKNWRIYTGKCCPISANKEVNNYKITPKIDSEFYITSLGDTDFYCGFPTVSPCGGNHSFRIGDLMNGSRSAKAKTFIKIPKDSNSYTFHYYYAVVFTDLPHGPISGPRYQIKFTDSTTNFVIDSNTNYLSMYSYGYSQRIFDFNSTLQNYYYKSWTKKSIQINGYANKTISIEYEVGDCAENGHLAYLYVDFSCNDFECKCKNMTLEYKKCHSSISLYAPPNYETYDWRDSSMNSIAITKTDTFNLISNSKSKYYVILKKCCRLDTLSVNIINFEIKNQIIIDDSLHCLLGNNFSIQNNSKLNNYLLRWDFGDGTFSYQKQILKQYEKDGIYKIKLIVNDSNNCQDTFYSQLIVYPRAKIKLKGDTICFGQYFYLEAEDSTGNVVKYKWYFDNTSYNGKKVFYQSNKVGQFDITLISQTNKGCIDTFTSAAGLSVLPLPNANFTFNKFSDYYSQINYEFLPNDIKAQNHYFWNIGNRNYKGAYQVIPFADTGIFEISLMVTDSIGCMNEFKKAVHVQYDTIRLFAPNAFTPNQNSLNEVFLPQLNYFNEFEIYIYNRWGELLFHSTDANIGWDGTFKGIDVQQDVYFWSIKVISYNKLRYTYEGTVTLLR